MDEEAVTPQASPARADPEQMRKYLKILKQKNEKYKSDLKQSIVNTQILQAEVNKINSEKAQLLSALDEAKERLSLKDTQFRQLNEILAQTENDLNNTQAANTDLITVFNEEKAKMKAEAEDLRSQLKKSHANNQQLSSDLSSLIDAAQNDSAEIEKLRGQLDDLNNERDEIRRLKQQIEDGENALVEEGEKVVALEDENQKLKEQIAKSKANDDHQQLIMFDDVKQDTQNAQLIEQLKADLEQMAMKMETNQKEDNITINKMRIENEEKDSIILSLRSQLEKLTLAANENEANESNEKCQMKECINNLQQKLSLAQSENQKLIESQSANDSRIANLVDEMQKNAKQHESIIKEQKDEMNKLLQAKLNELTQTNEKSVNTLKERLALKETEVEELKKQIVVIKTMEESMKEKNNEISKLNRSLEELANLNNENQLKIESCEKQNQVLDKTNANLESENLKFKQTLQELQTKLITLESNNKKLEQKMEFENSQKESNDQDLLMAQINEERNAKIELERKLQETVLSFESQHADLLLSSKKEQEKMDLMVLNILKECSQNILIKAKALSLLHQKLFDANSINSLQLRVDSLVSKYQRVHDAFQLTISKLNDANIYINQLEDMKETLNQQITEIGADLQSYHLENESAKTHLLETIEELKNQNYSQNDTLIQKDEELGKLQLEFSKLKTQILDSSKLEEGIQAMLDQKNEELSQLGKQKELLLENFESEKQLMSNQVIILKNQIEVKEKENSELKLNCEEAIRTKETQISETFNIKIQEVKDKCKALILSERESNSKVVSENAILKEEINKLQMEKDSLLLSHQKEIENQKQSFVIEMKQKEQQQEELAKAQFSGKEQELRDAINKQLHDQETKLRDESEKLLIEQKEKFAKEMKILTEKNVLEQKQKYENELENEKEKIKHEQEQKYQSDLKNETEKILHEQEQKFENETKSIQEQCEDKLSKQKNEFDQEKTKIRQQYTDILKQKLSENESRYKTEFENQKKQINDFISAKILEKDRQLKAAVESTKGIIQNKIASFVSSQAQYQEKMSSFVELSLPKLLKILEMLKDKIIEIKEEKTVLMELNANITATKQEEFEKLSDERIMIRKEMKELKELKEIIENEKREKEEIFKNAEAKLKEMENEKENFSSISASLEKLENEAAQREALASEKEKEVEEKLMLLATTERKISIRSQQIEMDITQAEMEAENIRRARSELEKKRHKFAQDSAQHRADVEFFQQEKQKVEEQSTKAQRRIEKSKILNEDARKQLDEVQSIRLNIEEQRSQAEHISIKNQEKEIQLQSQEKELKKIEEQISIQSQQAEALLKEAISKRTEIEKREEEARRKTLIAEEIERTKSSAQLMQQEANQIREEATKLMNEAKIAMESVQNAKMLSEKNEFLLQEKEKLEQKNSDLQHKLKIAISKIKSDLKKSNVAATNEVLKRSILQFIAQDFFHREQMLPGILSLLDCSDTEREEATQNLKKSRKQ